MKKQIDPNLNDIFDIDEFDEIDVNEQKPSSKPIERAENDADMLLRVKSYEKKADEQKAPAQDSTEQQHSSSHSSSHHSSSHGSSHHGSHSSSHHHSHKHKKEKKKTSTAARIAIIFLLLILLFVFAVIGTFIYLEHKGKSEMTPDITQAQESFEETIEYNGHTYKYNKDVVAVAFIGVDKEELGDETIAGSAGQADADLVFTVDTNTGRANVIAIPRDTMVEVNLYSESGVDLLRQEEMQLCLSYAYGTNPEASAQNVITSMERILYNVPIEKYFVLDLDGIGPINDAIGGVTVESLYDFSGYDIHKGDVITLEGDMAQVYVRQRDMNDINASLNRTDRQIQYIKAFTSQLLPAVTNDFGTVRRLYNQAASYSATNLNLSNVTFMASLLLSKGINEFDSTTLSGEMVASKQSSGAVYAEFYDDRTATFETVLNVFYIQID